MLCKARFLVKTFWNAQSTPEHFLQALSTPSTGEVSGWLHHHRATVTCKWLILHIFFLWFVLWPDDNLYQFFSGQLVAVCLDICTCGFYPQTFRCLLREWQLFVSKALPLLKSFIRMIQPHRFLNFFFFKSTQVWHCLYILLLLWFSWADGSKLS